MRMGDPLDVMTACTINEYLDRSARKLTTADMDRLLHLRNRLIAKAESADPKRHTRLAHQANLLVRFLTARRRALDPDSPFWSEMAAAAYYLLKGMDFIPDDLEEVGYDDDALVLDRFFDNHRAEIMRLGRLIGLRPEQLERAMP